MRYVKLLPVLLVIAIAAAAVIGLETSRTSAQEATPATNDEEFVGSWRITSETPVGTSQGLLTLMADGTAVFSGRPAAPTGGDPPVVFVSAGHGAWEQTGPSTASASFTVFIADGEGNFLWVVTDSVEMTLAADGASWSGPYSSTTADPNGNVLGTVPGTAQAARITVQSIPTLPATPTA